MLEELILEAWERAGRPHNREFVHSIIYGDAPAVVTLAKEVKRLKERQLTQSQTKYLVKFLKLRLMSKPNQAIEEILQTLKEKL